MGGRAEYHCTGLGKAMLANMPQEKVETYLQRELEAYTDKTITDPQMLSEELLYTKQRGYAIDDMEHEFGVKCIAMPIFDNMKKVYAAISVSGHATHFTDEKIEEWAILMKKYVSKIQDRL